MLVLFSQMCFGFSFLVLVFVLLNKILYKLYKHTILLYKILLDTATSKSFAISTKVRPFPFLSLFTIAIFSLWKTVSVNFNYISLFHNILVIKKIVINTTLLDLSNLICISSFWKSSTSNYNNFWFLMYA